MAEYQQIEYRIAPDGQVVETVLNATGDRCLSTTRDMEQALGILETQALLPDYYTSDECGSDEVLIEQSLNPINPSVSSDG